MATPEEIKIRIIARDETRKAMESVRKEMNQTSKVASKLKVAIGAIIGSQVLRYWFETNKTFQSLRMTLNVVSSSADDAARSWDRINDLVTKLPVDLQQLTTAFVRMRALGIEPTNETIIALTNIASGMGKDLMQVTEAVADAITGEFERLKEFGIKAKSEGDRVSFTFRSVTTEVGKNAEEILRYLKSIGEVEFAGAATDQMKTIGGAVSNLGVSFDKLAVSLQRNEETADIINSIGFAIDYLTSRIEEYNEASKGFTLFDELPSFQAGIIARDAILGQILGGKEESLTGAAPGFALVDPGVPLPESATQQGIAPKTFVESIDLTEKAEAAVKKYRDSINKNNQALDEYNNLVYGLSQIRKEANLTDEEFNKILNEQFELYLKNTDQLGQYTDRLKEIERAAEEMARRMEDAITDAIVNMGQGMTSFGDLAMGVLRSVYAEIVRAQIAKPIASAASGYLGNIFENFDLGSFFGMRAAGGPVAANRPYIVGERGPELFVPSSSGAISPNGAPQPVQITYNIQSWDSRDTMTAIQQSAPQIVGIVQNAFNKRGRRGPMG
jgi:hypothetical protein